MKFLQKNDLKKVVLVISDIHIGAGEYVDGKRNYLEDFHYDKELCSFLEYYCTDKYSSTEVELIINGDFLDFLAVPFVKFFDDEFWSEKASIEKLNMILEAHPEVMKALAQFASTKNKTVRYIVGNHDAEFIFESMRERFINHLNEMSDKEVKIEFKFGNEEYRPHKDVAIVHGHEYEVAHSFDDRDSIITAQNGEKYFLPPWGSYYVTRIINKFKGERDHINAVRPIKSFMIFGLIFDTLFTLRFMFANIYYFMMVRFLHFFKYHRNIKNIVNDSLRELELFQDYEMLTRDYFEENPDVKTLIVGHTHDPSIRHFADGSTFINTGTWTKMINLDFSKVRQGVVHTFAKIDIRDDDQYQANLYCWKGQDNKAYREFY